MSFVPIVRTDLLAVLVARPETRTATERRLHVMGFDALDGTPWVLSPKVGVRSILDEAQPGEVWEVITAEEREGWG